MPSQERFRARPMWACLEPCPVSKITSFGLDSSRSRKSVVVLVHMVSFPTVPIPPHPMINGKRDFDRLSKATEGARSWYRHIFPPGLPCRYSRQVGQPRPPIPIPGRRDDIVRPSALQRPGNCEAGEESKV